jgi:Rieske Fe-S protein
VHKAQQLSDISLTTIHMSQGPLKAAVYRDENGDLHKMAATCTHLGCVVRASSVAP